MNVDSVSPALPALSTTPEEQARPADASLLDEPAAADPGGQLGYTIVLPTPEQLQLLEEMGLPISKEELDALRQQKAEQDKAQQRPLLQAGSFPAPQWSSQLPPNPY